MIKIGYNIKKTTAEFIQDCINIHGEKYIYDKTVYVSALLKVYIECKIHGEFLQTPNKHLLGQGCPKCRKNKKISKIEFIDKSNIAHNCKYDYSLVNFKNVRSKIKIICAKHGEFEQIVHNHMNGQGCYKCGVSKIDKNYFISESIKKHDNKYDYSLIKEIKNNKEKVDIICSTHGIFKQRVSQHLNGQNCRKCYNIEQRVNIYNKIKNGTWCVPNFNVDVCSLLDKISKEKNIIIRHALNGGEFYIDKLGYWVDGYDEVNNVVYEYYEKYHFIKGKLKNRDINREEEIKKYLKCEFIIFNYFD